VSKALSTHPTTAEVGHAPTLAQLGSAPCSRGQLARDVCRVQNARTAARTSIRILGSAKPQTPGPRINAIGDLLEAAYCAFRISPSATIPRIPLHQLLYPVESGDRESDRSKETRSTVRGRLEQVWAAVQLVEPCLSDSELDSPSGKTAKH
jgi:hypothetical protein